MERVPVQLLVHLPEKVTQREIESAQVIGECVSFSCVSRRDVLKWGMIMRAKDRSRLGSQAKHVAVALGGQGGGMIRKSKAARLDPTCHSTPV